MSSIPRTPIKKNPDTEMHAYIPSTGEVETGRFQDFFLTSQPAYLMSTRLVRDRLKNSQPVPQEWHARLSFSPHIHAHIPTCTPTHMCACMPTHTPPNAHKHAHIHIYNPSPTHIRRNKYLLCNHYCLTLQQLCYLCESIFITPRNK